MMDGTIEVESEYGKGSTFTVRIRQIITDARPIGKEVVENLKAFRFLEGQGRKAKNVEFVSMPYGKVLVVDDVQTNLDVAKGMMMAYDLTIHCVTSGRQAIELIRDEQVHYDVVFMDHMMPELDGIETVRIIREEIGTEYAKTVPIVALTANAIVGNDKMFLENGFQAFLSKPIDIVKLDAVLHEWVMDKQSEKTLQEAKQEKPRENNKNEAFSRILEQANIDGVDMSSGMRRFNNSANVYLRVISSYVQNIPKSLDMLRGVTEATLAEYAVTVHGIKGSCYGISADTLGRMAEALEVAAKTGDAAKVLAGNEPFIQNVEELLPQLAELVKKADAVDREASSGKEKKSAPENEMLTKLLDACRDYDIDQMQQI
jgi:CheY-like chemotaxis protein